MQLGHPVVGSSPVEPYYKCSNEIVKTHLVKARWETQHLLTFVIDCMTFSIYCCDGYLSLVGHLLHLLL